MRIWAVFLLGLQLGLGTLAFAVDEPLRDGAFLRRAVVERVVRVGSARVLLADYALLKRDFPGLRGRSVEEIDQWILDEAGYVTEAQAAQEQVNTAIRATGETRTVLRPEDYGRAFVAQVEGGLLDVKGTGTNRPRAGSHANGLATLGEVIREYIYSRLIQMILEDGGSTHGVIETYAVIDWGFDVKQPDGSLSRAGAILRQGHRRSDGIVSILRAAEALPIERLLRSYGVTSTGADRDRDAEEINIQASEDGALVDFGAYLVVERFSRPVRNSFEQAILMSPEDPDFPQPDLRRRVPFELWGSSISRWDDPQGDNPWAWSHELAIAIQQGRAGREAAWAHVQNLLAPIQDILESTPRNCSEALIGN